MALADHLRELRARLMRSVLVADRRADRRAVLLRPAARARARALQPGPEGAGPAPRPATINGAGGPLLLQLKLCGVAAVVITSPYWLLQIWGFIVPGLHANEKRGPGCSRRSPDRCSSLGVAVGYYVLPKGLEVLIGFTPTALTNLVDFGEYFSFMTRMLLVFGVAFEIPLFVVLLNLAGVVSGRRSAATGRGSWSARSCSPPSRRRRPTRSRC